MTSELEKALKREADRIAQEAQGRRESENLITKEAEREKTLALERGLQMLNYQSIQQTLALTDEVAMKIGNDLRREIDFRFEEIQGRHRNATWKPTDYHKNNSRVSLRVCYSSESYNFSYKIAYAEDLLVLVLGESEMSHTPTIRGVLGQSDSLEKLADFFVNFLKEEYNYCRPSYGGLNNNDVGSYK